MKFIRITFLKKKTQISSIKKSTFNDNEKSDVLKSGKKINE